MLDRHPTRVDGALVGAVGLPLVLLGAEVVSGDGWWKPVFALAVGTGMVLPLTVRRIAPGWVLAVVCAVGAVQLLVLATPASNGSVPLPADGAFAVALYTLAARARTPLQRWVGVPVGLGAAVLCATSWGIGYLAVLVLTVVVALVSGTLRRVRAAYVEGLVQRAESVELGREQAIRLAESGERARIAREMHDVVAHSLSVIIVQADGGAYAARTDPARAVDVLATISATGREALTQMRHLLGVLREDPDSRGAAEPTAPQPGLHDLPALVEQLTRTGLPLHADLGGTVRSADVPGATGLVAYRVVQESLTNVLKHAGRVGRVDVTVERIGDRLRVEVSDDGRGAAAGPDARPGPADTTRVLSAPAGQGLRGMRERVALVGGQLVAGPRPGGGFRTVATLPAPARDGRTAPVPGVAPPARVPQPAREQPAREQPVREQPVREQPVREQPVRERPASSGDGAWQPWPSRRDRGVPR